MSIDARLEDPISLKLKDFIPFSGIRNYEKRNEWSQYRPGNQDKYLLRESVLALYNVFLPVSIGLAGLVALWK